MCVSVSILQGSGEVVCALWLSVKSSIVPFKTKELLCVQTQQAVASHSVELCWNHSNSPRINAVTLPKPHTHRHTHTHKLSPCLSVCLPLTHAHKQTGSQVLKGRRAAQLCSAKADTLDSHCQAGEEWSGEEREPVTQGSKTFPLLWTRLTLWGHWQSALLGARALLADITLTSNTPGPESKFPSPSYLLIPPHSWSKRVEKQLVLASPRRWSREYQQHCLSNFVHILPQRCFGSFLTWVGLYIINPRREICPCD